MKVSRTRLADVLLLEPDIYRDERGVLFEQYQARRYAAAGVPADFVQDNISFSEHGVLRGLHLQHPNAQAKLVTVLAGEVFDVAVDVRVGSPTFGQWAAAALSAENRRQLYVPEGFAHGFCVTNGPALLLYKCGDYYCPRAGLAVCWNDPDLDIPWPIRQPMLSAGDRSAPRLAEIDRARLPPYAPTA
jgi:dTDP-4-dehydrorhamnose 3,5-epimerase